MWRFYDSLENINSGYEKISVNNNQNIIADEGKDTISLTSSDGHVVFIQDTNKKNSYSLDLQLEEIDQIEEMRTLTNKLWSEFPSFEKNSIREIYHIESWEKDRIQDLASHTYKGYVFGNNEFLNIYDTNDLYFGTKDGQMEKILFRTCPKLIINTQSSNNCLLNSFGKEYKSDITVYDEDSEIYSHTFLNFPIGKYNYLFLDQKIPLVLDEQEQIQNIFITIPQEQKFYIKTAVDATKIDINKFFQCSYISLGEEHNIIWGMEDFPVRGPYSLGNYAVWEMPLDWLDKEDIIIEKVVLNINNVEYIKSKDEAKIFFQEEQLFDIRKRKLIFFNELDLKLFKGEEIIEPSMKLSADNGFIYVYEDVEKNNYNLELKFFSLKPENEGVELTATLPIEVGQKFCTIRREYGYKTSLSNSSWESIALACQGKYEVEDDMLTPYIPWGIGDKKEAFKNFTNINIEYIQEEDKEIKILEPNYIEATIIGKFKDRYSKNGQLAPLTFQIGLEEAPNIIQNDIMNEEFFMPEVSQPFRVECRCENNQLPTFIYKNRGGWEDSVIKNKLMPKFYERLLEEIKENIEPVEKETIYYDYSSQIGSNKLFLPSLSEIKEVYDLFQDLELREKYKFKSIWEYNEEQENNEDGALIKKYFIKKSENKVEQVFRDEFVWDNTQNPWIENYLLPKFTQVNFETSTVPLDLKTGYPLAAMCPCFCF